ncbi:MAG TPA: glutamyl-tRNA reductase [Chloroflexota bacterium]|jgi:glutamyl-tRNA reductase|nr:glutamyl-tRNA reductase [Chloroflexota bacterium]
MTLTVRASTGTPVDLVAPLVLGVDHAVASLPMRERLAAAVADPPAVFAHLRAHAAEAAVLSTCNRTELYLVGSDLVGQAMACLASAARVPLDELAACLWLRTGLDAAAHLFAVTAGIESQLLGETEILRQVRAAHATAQRAGATGPVLSALFRQALGVGKRARAQTGISRGAASVGSAAAAIVRQEMPPAARRHAVVVGAGAAAERVLVHLRGLGFARVDVVNRTVERARRLAAPPGEAFGLEALPGLLARADAVLCATAAPSAVVHLRDAAIAVHERNGRPLLLIDLAVPRDVEPAVADLPGVRLYDIDAVQARAEADRERRSAEVARVQALIDAEVAAFGRWIEARRAAPTIARLRAAAERRRLAELDRATRGLSAGERAAVDQATRAVLNALLHGPTVALRDGAPEEAALADRLADALVRARSYR